MPIELLSPAVVALLPVLVFLAVLLLFDSYKLVRPAAVIGALVSGVLAAGASYLVGAQVLGRVDMSVAAFSRYVAPVSEELLKGLIIVFLVRAHRIGFLVDAAVFGFAVGSGFALIENLYYLHLAPDAGMATWIVRGFGTAVMHGGVTAIFAVLGIAVLERSSRAGLRAFAPGFVLAVLLHSAFNHLNHSPRLATLATLLALPPLMALVFQRSERALGNWLGRGFDADAKMLELINSGRFADSPPGKYLQELKRHFAGPLVADALCYLRLYTELSLRAKGLLMMRENGFEVLALDDETRSRLAEMRHLERTVGATVLRTLRPLLRMRRKELWQINMLESG
jgi:protease PrsW